MYIICIYTHTYLKNSCERYHLFIARFLYQRPRSSTVLHIFSAALLDRDLWCCSRDLLEPLSQFGGHSPECSGTTAAFFCSNHHSRSSITCLSVWIWKSHRISAPSFSTTFGGVSHFQPKPGTDVPAHYSCLLVMAFHACCTWIFPPAAVCWAASEGSLPRLHLLGSCLM